MHFGAATSPREDRCYKFFLQLVQGNCLMGYIELNLCVFLIEVLIFVLNNLFSTTLKGDMISSSL